MIEDRIGTTKPQERPDTSLWPATDPLHVKAAGEAIGKEVKPLDELYAKYREPLRVHFHTKFRSFPTILRNADDLQQDFALKRILGEDWLIKWEPRQGRFRDFLRTSLNNFVWDWWHRQPEYKDWKRCQQTRETPSDGTPGLDRIQIVELPEELANPAPEEEDFNLAWAQTVLAQVLKRLEQTCKDSCRDQPRSGYIWEVFRLRTLNRIFKGSKPASYARLVKALHLRSPTEGTNMLLSAKRMFRTHLQEVIAEYTGRSNATNSELRELTRFVERLAKKKKKKATTRHL